MKQQVQTKWFFKYPLVRFIAKLIILSTLLSELLAIFFPSFETRAFVTHHQIFFARLLDIHTHCFKCVSKCDFFNFFLELKGDGTFSLLTHCKSESSIGHIISKKIWYYVWLSEWFYFMKFFITYKSLRHNCIHFNQFASHKILDLKSLRLLISALVANQALHRHWIAHAILTCT